MAIAPVNKFINIAVPVTPGKQKLYEVPTGTSALLLYLQVANVGIGSTFPKVTFTQQRTQRSTGNKREVRVIKDVEIPPNDAAIIVDGRLVLEKTPLVLDKIFIEGKQQQVGNVVFADYHEPTGIVTITTKDSHPFKAGDPVALAGLAFQCIAGQTGITTNVFPDPIQSYTVESITGVVGVSKTFTSFIGPSTPIGIPRPGSGLPNPKDYSHFYNSAIHYYERSKRFPIEVVTATSGSLVNQITRTASAGTQATATAALSNITLGNALTGDLTITNGGAGYITAPDVTITPHSDDTNASGGSATVTVNANETITQISLSGGQNYTKAPTITIAPPEGTTYDPVSGTLSVFASNHGFSTGDKVRLKNESFAFTCTTDGNSSVKKYPRKTGENQNVGKPDFAYGKILEAGLINPNRIEIFIGKSSDASTHTFVAGQSLSNNVIKLGSQLDIERAIYYGGGDDTQNGVLSPDRKVVEGKNLGAGELLLRFASAHNFSGGDKLRIIDNGIYFSCTMDNRETEHSYPRVTDPASGAELTVRLTDAGGSALTNKELIVNVGESKSGGFFAPLEMELVASILENSTA